jgi:hypothetical protein
MSSAKVFLDTNALLYMMVVATKPGKSGPKNSSRNLPLHARYCSARKWFKSSRQRVAENSECPGGSCGKSSPLCSIFS